MRGLDPIFQVLRTVPPLAWLPLSLAAFREAQPSAIFVIFITSIWPIIINTAVGVRNVPQDYRNVAAVIRLRGPAFFWKIVLPAAAPYIFTGLRIGIGLSWLAIVAAEMLIGGVGIGFFIWDAWNSSNLSDIIVALVYVGLVGFALDRVVALAGRLGDPRHGRELKGDPTMDQLSLHLAARRHLPRAAPVPVLRQVDLQIARGEYVADHRPFRLRQVDPAERHRRPAAAVRRRRGAGRQGGRRPRPRPRRGLPEPQPAALADLLRERPLGRGPDCSAARCRAPNGMTGRWRTWRWCR